MTRHALRSEEGSIFMVALILMAVMLSVALASISLADTGQERSREQRERESALNLVEGVLYSQGFTLAQGWPGNGTAGTSMPVSCDQTSTASLCPSAGTLAGAHSTNPAVSSFANVDASADVTWSTRVRDNGGPLAESYDRTLPRAGRMRVTELPIRVPRPAVGTRTATSSCGSTPAPSCADGRARWSR